MLILCLRKVPFLFFFFFFSERLSSFVWGDLWQFQEGAINKQAQFSPTLKTCLKVVRFSRRDALASLPSGLLLGIGLLLVLQLLLLLLGRLEKKG